MHLTREEEQMLNGEFGTGTQKAMELLVAIGDAYDAEKMIPISRAHAASSGQEGDLYFVELLADAEHAAFPESSATPYVNSMIGAYTNREAAQSALAAGIIGKTPKYGLHIKENRKGTFLVDVEASLRDEFDYTLLG